MPSLTHDTSLTSPASITSLVGMTLTEMKEWVLQLGQPAFRATQLHHWVYVHCVRNFDQMTNLSKDFRTLLEEHCQPDVLQLHSKQVSQDGTVKYLFRLPDGELIESVLMYFRDRGSYSLCISTQVGCAMNCSFCATGKLGLKRHLSVAEIVDQYLFAQQDANVEIRNIVFMGQGEPLHNYDATLKAIRILNESAEVGMRRITVSTSGVVSHIEQLAEEKMPLTLAVSLHAPDNETRSQIMPINKRWPLEVLMPVLRHYSKQTNRRMTIEYILIRDLNDTDDHAHRLAGLLQGLHANINLIPYNPIDSDLPGCPDYQRSTNRQIERFHTILTQHGRKVTTRMERGVDIDAACGQLANRHQQVES